ncbi:MAG: O-Methyltransferase involved in polyketide biosynthesis [Mucilaginibacter sp.]|nr:O-Methyltransferase involved in polyketide biosynthesis [Mucilaginibacter sp.]
MQQSPLPNRDYSTISPSARSLLLLKGLTDIPFVREAAALISSPEKYQPDFNIKDPAFWGRVVHFEARYKSINQLLSSLSAKNILEVSSGFSFRGLDTVIHSPVHYIDTDLPNVIDTKLNLLEALQQHTVTPKGKLETLTLNALHETEFTAIVDRFPDGEIVIVNEGLLVYLDMNEKRKLCHNIRSVLQKSGGYWITADIYIKSEMKFPDLQANDQLQEFFKEHRIEENKFDSFELAEAFFKSEGLVIDKEAEPDPQSSDSLKYLIANATKEQLAYLGKVGRIRKSWRLKLAE